MRAEALVSRLTPGELARRLSELRVQVDEAHVELSAPELPDYAGGPRPSGVLRLSGAGHVGLGENVAFSAAEQARFLDFAAGWQSSLGSGLASARLRVGEALGASGTPYERAALEAALIDLALKQAGLSLFDLTGVRARALRFVVSFAATPEPVTRIRDWRALSYDGDFKVDVDPSWSDTVLNDLSKQSGIVILDFKGRGDAALAEQLCALFPHALLEDPPPDFRTRAGQIEPQRIARDASLHDANAVAAARALGEAVNLKAPRMGGPLELLRGLEHAPSAHAPTLARIPAYLGGMFEVGVGRVQARQLAALFCPDAPNDLALNVVRGEAPLESVGNSPVAIQLDVPGFGAA